MSVPPLSSSFGPRLPRRQVVAVNRLSAWHDRVVALVGAVLLIAGAALLGAQPASAQPVTSVLSQLIDDVTPGDLVDGADGFGPIRDDIPVAPLMRGGERIGWTFIASDFVGTTGYSGKPIHTMVAVDNEAVVQGVTLAKHSEPIVLIGIPESKIEALVAGYAGLDLVAEATSGGTTHDLEIIAGATVTIMVIDDSIVRAGLKVARHLGLGGLSAPEAPTGPRYEIDPEATAAGDWMTLEGDGTLRRLSLDVGQVNAAFEGVDDPRAAERPIDAPGRPPLRAQRQRRRLWPHRRNTRRRPRCGNASGRTRPSRLPDCASCCWC